VLFRFQICSLCARSDGFRTRAVPLFLPSLTSVRSTAALALWLFWVCFRCFFRSNVKLFCPRWFGTRGELDLMAFPLTNATVALCLPPSHPAVGPYVPPAWPKRRPDCPPPRVLFFPSRRATPVFLLTVAGFLARLREGLFFCIFHAPLFLEFLKSSFCFPELKRGIASFWASFSPLFSGLISGHLGCSTLFPFPKVPSMHSLRDPSFHCPFFFSGTHCPVVKSFPHRLILSFFSFLTPPLLDVTSSTTRFRLAVSFPHLSVSED